MARHTGPLYLSIDDVATNANVSQNQVSQADDAQGAANSTINANVLGSQVSHADDLQGTSNNDSLASSQGNAFGSPVPHNRSLSVYGSELAQRPTRNQRQRALSIDHATGKVTY